MSAMMNDHAIMNSKMQLSSEQITEKLVELVRRHVFIYDVKSDKHRDGQRLQTLGKASAWK